MSNTIHAYGELLTASEDTRTLTYKLLPFNEAGRTNKGSVTVSKGAVKIPSDISHLILNAEHRQDAPLGRFLSVQEADDALYATVALSDFERGNDALQAARAGDLTGISVEVRNPLIRNGVMYDGELTGAALCKTPAYSSALLMASDTGDIEGALAALQEAVQTLSAAIAAPTTPEDSEAQEAPEAEATPAEAEVAEATNPTPEKEDDMSESTAAPAAEFLAASASGATSKSALEDLSEMLASGASMSATPALHAALTDIAAADSYSHTAIPNYIGELYQTGRGYTAKFAPLMGQKTLVAKSIKSWKFSTLPQVAYDYAGFPAALASNTPVVTEVSATAAELAGGHTLDRLTLTLNDGGYVASYLRECTDDWERKMDKIALDFINTNSIAVTGAGGTAWHKLLVGAQMIAETGTPEWAIVGSDLWLTLMETQSSVNLELLSKQIGLTQGSLEGFRLVPAPLSRTDLNGKVIVGSTKATELYTLAGGPVRVNAADVARNGELRGVWGAYATLLHDNRELIKVS
ncbi:hypothetical protein [Arthrobacter sp. B2a2-09]|uniref:hypothetical protein n=1 Tax=Arthrobacter sp. B2a2-09 TaxID=2952822 RepID=UPI0022CD6249|nr:hypothetical protein [Arthrobacter sp. B2a2-09]MCZ9883715.1 hypothetical protein [Arthrobacter sp. B2a2-09]